MIQVHINKNLLRIIYYKILDHFRGATKMVYWLLLTVPAGYDSTIYESLE